MTTMDPQPPRLLTLDEVVTFPGVPADHRFAYGPDPAQFGDLYLPPQLGPHPVVLLLHGGCWQAQYNLTLIGQLGAALRQAVLGMTVQPLGVQEAKDIDSAIATMKEARPDALFMITDVLTSRYTRQVVDFAAQHQLPTMFQNRIPVAEGGLMFYGPSLTDAYRRAAYYVDRILKGAKPGDLPVEQPMKFELVINLKTAKALGLTIPPALLFQATEVIQ
jgi:ABC-type uncharacterized transport system substrate-binding protein